LDTWGPQQNLFPAIYDALQSNWGDFPSRTVMRPCPVLPEPDAMSAMDYASSHYWSSEHQTGACLLRPGEWKYVESCFAGQTLQQVLERITFSFTIDGISRACTHQLVRTRLGAGFMQHGGRDNDWRHRTWTMPETIRRACEVMTVLTDEVNGYPSGMEKLLRLDQKTCITDWEPLDRLMREYESELAGPAESVSLQEVIEDYLMQGRRIYSAFVDAGIPWQDARRLLWMGTQTYIHADYNYLALKGVIGKRGEPVMDWEINCVAQLMLREVKMKCPPLLSQYLMPLSDAGHRDAMAGLESWSPTGKYPNPYELCECGHHKANHLIESGVHDEPQTLCVVCKTVHDYTPVDTLARTHRPEQNPFWILHPDSMAGGPVRWIHTNGVWPEELK